MRKYGLIIGLILLVVCALSYIVYSGNGSAMKDKTVIMAFGDSLTYGQGDREEQGYVGKLQNELNEKYPGKNFTIENYGVRNRESGGVLLELAKPATAARLKNADTFILFIGTNDLINGNGGNLKKIHPERIAEAKEDYLQNLEKILAILRETNKDAPILVLGLYNPYPEGGQRIEPLFDEWNASTIRLVKQVRGVKYVPTNDLFKGKDKQQYFSDSIHLNKKGYTHLEKRILEEYPGKHHK
ncbi:GDSL-type esterase/lipase family protein [Bacillus sp. FJAT-27445]|uniref:GDSL-type esterase/lipase family protein n=1 Tax=Bacillus sp. FJAT-27445 TaxID=1679166 RepID=UPI0007440936|nr:GDSL-type esterase/lipase family protein [Bacillus sp. FJAT-27445]